MNQDVLVVRRVRRRQPGASRRHQNSKIIFLRALSQKADLARTHLVWTDDRLAGFFSLCAGSVLRSDAPTELTRGLPGYPIPTILIARFGVAEQYQGAGIGGRMLAQALRVVLRVNEIIAVRLVIVDPTDVSAAGFYRRYGFIDGPGNGNRLYRRLDEVRTAIQ